MSPFRIGCAPYLNAKPLLYGLEESVLFCAPAELPDRLRKGLLDAGLAPLGACLTEEFALVDGVGIVADGPVKSVILVHDLPLSEVRSIALDPDTRSSFLLLRVLLENFLGFRPEYVPFTERADARLMIGDRALAFRRADPGAQLLDLGQGWREKTGLPFVFAAWAIPRGAARAAELAALLREAKRRGLAARSSIAKDESELEYLTRYIRYDVEAREKEGIRRFVRELRILGERATDERDLLWV
ncbi:Chorismate dehydratase [Methylacidimicrobium sp. AP8]|uniref:menaquinone biosynthesis protein n=1 Tax=Methylacidimicrobium sp. AP8 TaxID=2730359 RepID=UPI0018BF9870|nr:menaquinone biosynthesis protein [Methylacidimicrobium sp. AP8]CAB4244363.1 Chorismate dehydratase [Methylacidimicrobium sp. AP8]